MADYQAGKRYAQAAFAIAAEQGTIAAWRADLNDIATVLAESDAAGLLANSRVPLEARLVLVARMLDVAPLALNLAKLLVSKGRTAEARAVSDAFGRMADQTAGIEHATVTTAVPLSADQLVGIERQLGASLNKQVQATAAVDPSIVGGVIVRVGDKLLDGSVRTRLRQLRKELQGIR
jgi:F-type H+-transporting ATPase subunit delta